MKISYINNTFNVNKTPSFGYDKKANEQLKTELENYRASENYDWGNTLLQLQDYCNNLEDTIRISEKKASKNEEASDKLQDFIDLFLSAKEALCAYVTVTFSDSDYSDKEFNHYKKQLAIKKFPKDDWRKSVCEKIQEWCQKSCDIDTYYGVTDKTSKKIDKVKQQESPQVSDTESTLDAGVEKPTAAQSQLDKLNQKSFLEIFKNTPTSPKGFSDVAGMGKLKEDLNDKIIQYIANPEQAQLDLEEYGKTMPKAILLYGPPGTGKTYITQALSQEVQSPLFMLNISKAGSHYINMTSKNIKDAFEHVAQLSKESDKPVLLFLDEIDSLGFDRSSRTENEDLKQVSTLLQEIDKVKSSNVIIIGATNKVMLLDPAIRRRFDEKTLVDVPDVESIQALLKYNLAKYKKGQTLLKSDDDILEIAKLLKGFSNSSICNISKAAALNALKRDRADISIEDYQKAIKETSEEKPNRSDFLLEEVGSKKLGFSAY